VIFVFVGILSSILPVWRKAAVAAAGARTASMASGGRGVDLIAVDPRGPPIMMVVKIVDGSSCLDVSPFPSTYNHFATSLLSPC
jgi:hypothetical protein